MENMSAGSAPNGVPTNQAPKANLPESTKAPVNADTGTIVPNGETTGDVLKDAAKEAARRLKVKVDGQELEVDESELVKGYSKYKSADKKFQEAAKMRKQAEEFISMMKDPQKFFDAAEKLGHTPRELAEKYLAAQLEEEMLDPREKELRDTKRKLQEYEALQKKEQEEVERRRNDELKAKYAKDYTEQFTSALTETGIPATKHTVAEMAKYISRAAQMKFQMTALEAAQLVKEDIMEAHKRLIGDTDGETLIKLLGPEVANKVRKYDTSKIKDPNQLLKTPENQGEIKPRERGVPKKRMTPQQWRDYNRK